MKKVVTPKIARRSLLQSRNFPYRDTESLVAEELSEAMSLTIATVSVYVENQKQALQFWTEKVGLSVLRSHPIGLDLDWIELRDEGSGSCLVLYPRSMMPDWAQRKPSVVFECDDVQKHYLELSARGVNFTQPPKQLPWGLFAIFEDNEGNWFGLREKKLAFSP